MARYSLRGNAKLMWVPTIASVAAPTATEVNAGTDLSKAVTTINNLTFSNSRVTEPVLSDTFSPQIDGEQTAGDVSLVLHADNGVVSSDSTALAAAFTALADGAVGYLVAVPFGSVASATKVDVFPAKVLGRNRGYTTANEMAKYEVNVAVTAVPVKNVALT